MKRGKKTLPYALVLSMAFSMVPAPVYASENDIMNLPVQLYDFDADGLFYEYALGLGMDTLGLKESNNGEVTQGLVESVLGKDGNPVYKKNSIVSAAATIQRNVKDDANLRKFAIYNTLVSKMQSSGSTYSDILNKKDDHYFYDSWHMDSSKNVKTEDGLIYEGSKDLVWQHEGDGVINKGFNDHLTNIVNVEKNTDYNFGYWRTNENIKYQIKTLDGQVLLDNNATQFNTGNHDQVIIDIYRDDDGKDDLKFSIAKLTNTKTNITSENYLGEGGKTFISENWKSANYDQYTKAGGQLYNGKVYFQQVGDGVGCLTDASITYQTDILPNQNIILSYWLGDNGFKADGMSIDILDDNGILTTVNLEDISGSHEQNISVPQGTGTIKLRINGKAGSRIAALSVHPENSLSLPLGDYDETETKYNQGQLNSVDDCLTCMDYAYLRLKNFFNQDFSLNKKADKYNQMVLKNTGSGNQAQYTFDAGIKTKYDGNKFYNDDSGNESHGFFPLDYLDGEKFSDNNVTDPQNHNYNFGMKVQGDFIYKKGANQYFNFRGDDDVYVFINGKLAADLGGAHYSSDIELNVDEFAQANGILNGQKCEFSLFYLERHTSASNCYISTNLNIGKHAEYKFKSGTEGVELPEALKELVPVDEDEYYKDDIVANSEYNKKYDEYTDEDNDGVWKFQSWDNESQIIQNDSITFTGTWNFIPNQYKVSYEFESGTKGKELPEAVKDLKPTDTNKYLNQSEITAKVPTLTKVEDTDLDGTWVFKGYNGEGKATVNKANVTFTGTWEFIPNVYHAEYEFKSGTEGKNLPEAINQYLPTDNEDYVKGAHVDAKEPSSNVYEENGETWQFISWDKQSDTISNGNVKFVGIWQLVSVGHKANYTFISGTEGKELPKAINSYLPTDNTLYKNGSIVKALDLQESQYVDSINDGTWKFKSWNHKSQEMTNAGITFIGSWEFTSNQYNVSYEFESGTKGKELPQSVKDLKPTDTNKYLNKAEVTAQSPRQVEVEDTDLDGTWVFKGYNGEGKATVNKGDVTFTGTWEFVANTHKVKYSFESEDGSELPEAIKNLIPTDGQNYITGTTVKAQALTQTSYEDETRDGTWTFVKWDKEQKTVNKADVNFKGVWKFESHKYGVTYKFASKTEGLQLPNDIIQYLPTDETLYVKDKNVAALAPSQTTYKDDVNDGTWTFDKWDDQAKNMQKGGITFTGSWEFTPNQYNVSYEFESGTKGKELPQSVKDLKPTDTNKYLNKAEVTAQSPRQVEVEDTDLDGKWVFKGYNGERKATVNKDNVIFTGTWEFVANIHKVKYSFESEDGSELPDIIKNLLPQDDQEYTSGTEVDVKELTQTKINDEENDGTWTFESWDKNQDTVNNFDVEFKGVWKFTPNVYNVKYIFVSKDGKQLPDKVKVLLPTDNQEYINQDKVTVKSLKDNVTKVYTDDGVWVFEGFDDDEKEINKADVEFTGTWTFVKKQDQSSSGGNNQQSSSNNGGANQNGQQTYNEKLNHHKQRGNHVVTGDMTPIMYYCSMLFVSICGLFTALKKKMK
ncbi:SHIRT domain-containing protein [Coprobacillus sp. AF33-1AC]|uniref:SHIRT domain-containing protein n=1 Tax=Coprobacillus sp. AF33-1AC TaxID=2292032 RepID=UPI000E4D8C1C|nr:SHIRT domain-containing protein [Coprobacillus sp. AF33-1AC]RHM59355.1 fibro-slime domain-containing protein [Coprobacillus sp. AF33-1AC]